MSKRDNNKAPIKEVKKFDDNYQITNLTSALFGAAIKNRITLMLTLILLSLIAYTGFINYIKDEIIDHIIFYEGVDQPTGSFILYIALLLSATISFSFILIEVLKLAIPKLIRDKVENNEEIIVLLFILKWSLIFILLMGYIDRGHSNDLIVNTLYLATVYLTVSLITMAFARMMSIKLFWSMPSIIYYRLKFTTRMSLKNEFSLENIEMKIKHKMAQILFRYNVHYTDSDYVCANDFDAFITQFDIDNSKSRANAMEMKNIVVKTDKLKKEFNGTINEKLYKITKIKWYHFNFWRLNKKLTTIKIEKQKARKDDGKRS